MIEGKALEKLNKNLLAIGNNLQDTVNEVPDGILRELIIGAVEIRNTVIESMITGDKTGRIYTRKSVTHQASAPGEAPAVDHGELIRSIIFDVDRVALDVEIGAEAGAPYAKWLEFGTKNEDGSVKMEARPFLGPAVDANQDNIINQIGMNAFEIISNAIGSIL